ncbi:hypothetical protein [Actinoplanes subtropicus]|uniref:hypothetical protein n=1 Tax=Actinoplanes subtropicus TaxID=543632 RepID=UPI00068B9C73|nr:hypothetical protein [Actinoplanes subtropicus]
MRTTSSRTPRRAAALFVASAAVLLVAACGGNSTSSSGGTGTTGTGNGSGRNSEFTAYVECLQKNGVTITLPSRGPRPSGAPQGGGFPSGQPRPSGSFSGGGRGFPGGGGMFQKPADVDQATWDKAQAACASVRPSFGGGNRGGGMNAAYRNCLKQHGVTSTDGKLDTSNATVKKAMETCKVLRPQPSASPSA